MFGYDFGGIMVVEGEDKGLRICEVESGVGR